MVDPGLADHLRSLEVALARRDPTGIEGGSTALIADDFLEIGSSGRLWDRAAIVELMGAPERGTVAITDFAVAPLAERVVLVTY